MSTSPPYATLADVQRRMPQFLLTGTTKPTQDEAEALLTDSEAEMTFGLVNLGYDVTQIGPRSAERLRMAVCDLAIAKILYARAAAVGGDAAIVSANASQKRYDDFMAALADPDNLLVELSDTVRTDDAIDKPAGSYFACLQTDEEGNPIVPRRIMDERM